MEQKGLVEITLESPARYVAIPFEKIIDNYIQSKRQEASQIEEAKQDLLSDWKKIRPPEIESQLERFSVIEGDKKIFHKISEMIKETETELIAIASVTSLIQAEFFGVFDSLLIQNLQLNNSFRILTQVLNSQMDQLKILLNKLEHVINIKAKNPEFGLSIFPRIVIRDNKEILIFISDRENSVSKNSTCLCTNCKSIITAFSGVFENLWNNSIFLSTKFDQLENRNSQTQNNNGYFPRIDLNKVFESATEELIMLTSSMGLKKLSEMNLEEIAHRGVSIKIMAPITNENLKVSQDLLDYCELKHVSACFSPSILVDKESLYTKNTKSGKNFVRVTDTDYVKKTETMLNNLWNTSHFSSTSRISKFLGPEPKTVINIDEKSYSVYRKTMATIKNESVGLKNEDDIIREFLTAKKYIVKDIKNDVNRAYQSSGHAIIHPPTNFNLPKMLFHFFHVEKISSFGEEDAIQVAVWMETPNGPAFVPVTMIGDNPRSHEAFKIWFKGSPAADNVILVNKHEIEIRIHGNTMFVAWAVPIPLIGEYVIPPACVIIEGYGNLKTSSYVATFPSGYDFKIDTNGFDAFVTFIHPESEYSGQGTEGYIGRDEIMEITPTKKAPKISKFSKC